MKPRIAIAMALAALLLAGCQQQWVYNAKELARLRATGQLPKPNYDVTPQVVYRIDEHRFVSLENYDLCYGDNYYNDTRLGIHTKIWIREVDPASFRGRLIIDDPSGMNVVIPSARSTKCGDRGCNVPLLHSTDAGRTFRGMKYMHSFRPSQDSVNYTIAVTKDAFYVEKQRQYDSYVVRYPLVSNFVYGTDEPLPGNKRIEFNVRMPLGLRTPSGQDRFTCDRSIRPANLPPSQANKANHQIPLAQGLTRSQTIQSPIIGESLIHERKNPRHGPGMCNVGRVCNPATFQYP